MTTRTPQKRRSPHTFSTLVVLGLFLSFALPISSTIIKEDASKQPKKKQRKRKKRNIKRTNKKKARKYNPSLLKNLQKRATISIGYAEIKTKRMLTKARVAKKDQEVVSTSIMKKARAQMQKNRIDRKAFNDLVKQEIKAHKKLKKQA